MNKGWWKGRWAGGGVTERRALGVILYVSKLNTNKKKIRNLEGKKKKEFLSFDDNFCDDVLISVCSQGKI